MNPWVGHALRVAGALALLTLAGCDDALGPLRPHVPVAPAPGDATPEATVRSVEWSWNHKSMGDYRVLFTDDYRFAFSPLDPAGLPYQGDLWNRGDEMIFGQHFFATGTGTDPVPTTIRLEFGRTLTVQPDPRPGKQDRMHKMIRASFTLDVLDPSKETSVTGFETFYLARGDAALIPDELEPLGYSADSTRWYIERWEDYASGPGGGAQSQPIKNFTLGQIKALYH